MTGSPRDHGGGLDAAMAQFGGTRADWIDLSTGINPQPYPVGQVPGDAWTALPDTAALDRLVQAARRFWRVPDDLDILAAPGASALIARMPGILADGPVYVPGPTYNEHAAAILASGGTVVDTPDSAPNAVHVHPNNPDGRLWDANVLNQSGLVVIDESFCDVWPERSLVPHLQDGRAIVLKSFGKFWGLAGLRLGFAIGMPETLAPLREMLGPWAVAGPALTIGARALEDEGWAVSTRKSLAEQSSRLDRLMGDAGAELVGGTPLFRLYHVGDANAAQTHLGQHRIWSRIFPYSSHWLRLGLPPSGGWPQLEHALGTAGGAMQALEKPASVDPAS